jgi:hypothetical protein
MQIFILKFFITANSNDESMYNWAIPDVVVYKLTLYMKTSAESPAAEHVEHLLCSAEILPYFLLVYCRSVCLH